MFDIDPKRLNREELLVGACVGGVFILKFGVVATLIVPICSVLWALGGSVNKAFRRVGVAVVPAALAAVLTGSAWPLLAIPAAFGVMSIGYGIPSTLPPDAGSLLGRFFFKHFPEHADLFTRGTLYVLLALAFLPVWLA